MFFFSWHEKVLQLLQIIKKIILQQFGMTVFFLIYIFTSILYLKPISSQKNGDSGDGRGKGAKSKGGDTWWCN